MLYIYIHVFIVHTYIYIYYKTFMSCAMHWVDMLWIFWTRKKIKRDIHDTMSFDLSAWLTQIAIAFLDDVWPLTPVATYFIATSNQFVWWCFASCYSYAFCCFILLLHGFFYWCLFGSWMWCMLPNPLDVSTWDQLNTVIYSTIILKYEKLTWILQTMVFRKGKLVSVSTLIL